MTTAAIVAGLIFAALVALSTIFDGLAKLRRASLDADLLAGPRYRRADLELAVEAAVARSAFMRKSDSVSPDRLLELREHITAGVLDDLDAGNLRGRDEALA